MKSFSAFLDESSPRCVFTFGRFQPPHLGHGKLFEAMQAIRGGSTLRVYSSSKSGDDKNPLCHHVKTKYLRKMFPDKGRIFMEEVRKDVLDIARGLHSEGFKRITLVVGSDRESELGNLLKKYNGVSTKNGSYKFDSIESVSAGCREEFVASSTDQRKHIREGNFSAFAAGLPESFEQKMELYNDVRRALNLRDSAPSIDLKNISSFREAVKTGMINVGHEIQTPDGRGLIESLHTNHAVVHGKKYFFRDLDRV